MVNSSTPPTLPDLLLPYPPLCVIAAHMHMSFFALRLSRLPQIPFLYVQAAPRTAKLSRM
eukprot:3812317-Pleurochrysis_carterae.AAC.2